jgi:beta-phosphoglucomutase
LPSKLKIDGLVDGLGAIRPKRYTKHKQFLHLQGSGFGIMALKVVLFDFNGVIVDDEPIHAQLIQDVIAAENMRCSAEDVQRFVGRSDRACLQDFFGLRGRVLTPESLNKLLAQKTVVYQQRIQALDILPLFPGVKDLIAVFQSFNLKLGIVSGAQRGEIELVLAQAQLQDVFEVIIAAEDIATSKPSPEGYRQAVKQFSARYPELDIQPSNCLAIEDSFPGLEAAISARIPVVGVAHTYPFHMLQRRANWTVDALKDLEVARLVQVYSGEGERDWEQRLNNKRSEASDPALRRE